MSGYQRIDNVMGYGRGHGQGYGRVSGISQIRPEIRVWDVQPPQNYSQPQPRPSVSAGFIHHQQQRGLLPLPYPHAELSSNRNYFQRIEFHSRPRHEPYDQQRQRQVQFQGHHQARQTDNPWAMPKPNQPLPLTNDQVQRTFLFGPFAQKLELPPISPYARNQRTHLHGVTSGYQRRGRRNHKHAKRSDQSQSQSNNVGLGNFESKVTSGDDNNVLRTKKNISHDHDAAGETENEKIEVDLDLEPQIAMEVEETSSNNFSKVESDSGQNSHNFKIFQPNSFVWALTKEIPWMELEIKEQKILISHFNSWTDFYALSKDASDSVNAIDQKIYDHLENSSVPLRNPDVGSLCLAPFDNCFFRAEVTKVNGGQDWNFTVFFLDYGNSTQVQEKDLFQMPPHLRILPRCAVHCQLDLAVGEELTDELMEKFAHYQFVEVTPKEKIVDGQYLVGIGNIIPKTRLVLSAYPSRIKI